MKAKFFLQVVPYLITLVFISCGTKLPQSDDSLEVLLIKEGWEANLLDKGVVHYEYSKHFMDDLKSYQNINVLAINPKTARYSLDFMDILPSDSISAVGKVTKEAIFGINGTYYEKGVNSGKSTSYFKTNNVLIDSVQVPSGNLFAWKHEGAFYQVGNEFGIIRGNNKVYDGLKAKNVMSGSPLLIENYHPSGEHYVKDYIEDLTLLNYEHPDRHQGVRHPRTAVAITETGVILFIAVDGRSEKAQGMSAKELTQFLRKYFNPKDALNLDGGGSTTFWLKNATRSKTGVINYPTDNKKFDHYGQRSIRNGFYLIKD